MENVLFYLCIHVLLSVTVAEVVANNENVILQCDYGCVREHNISIGEGKNPELTYYIKKDNFLKFQVYLEYDGKKDTILTIKRGGGVTLKQPATKINLKITQNETTPNTTWYVFPFSIMNISNHIHTGKSFSFKLDHMRGDAEKGKHTFDVIFGPADLRVLPLDVKGSYIVDENKNFSISISLSGNPKPKVNLHTNSGTEVSCQLQSYEQKSYNCTASLNYGRELCNGTLSLNATGYKSIEQRTKLLVNFIPEAPKIKNATINTKNMKANVVWSPIHAGDCRVRYLLFYNGTHNILTQKPSISKKLELLNYDTSFTITLFVRAQVIFNNLTSVYSEPMPLTYNKPEPGPEPHPVIGSTNVGLIVGIVVGVILLFGGIILIIKRKQVHQFCLNKIRNSSNH